jgi:energy-coupling factor transporter ATP-binding protein EcfA2
MSIEVLLENVRSFCGVHRIPLRPLTLVVGENNSGKSTLLAVISAVSQPSFPSSRPALDEPPFDMSSYDSIASYKGGRAGRAEFFAIGLTDTSRRETSAALAIYRQENGQPRLAEFTVARAETQIRAKRSNDRLTMEVLSGGESVYKMDEVAVPPSFELSLQRVYPTLLQRVLASRRQQTLEKGVERVLPLLQRFQFGGAQHEGAEAGPSDALAPIRSKPLRTYDQTSDEFNPEGGHIPLVLARLFQQENGREKEVHAALAEFGADSGLLSNLRVRTLGNKPTDPFQILVELAGPARNLADVGYGVSQALPLIVESVLATEHRRLLVQQPEVHLHPRAQAALGTFFVKLVTAQHKNFVIETHSDFLLDRVRQEVAHRRIKSEDVLILFLEREGVETSAHQIALDDSGNIVNAPAGYRKFLLEEEVTLVDRTSQ